MNPRDIRDLVEFIHKDWTTAIVAVTVVVPVVWFVLKYFNDHKLVRLNDECQTLKQQNTSLRQQNQSHIDGPQGSFPSSHLYENKKVFTSIFDIVSRKINDAKKIAGQGKLELPASFYPQLLTEYQEHHKGCEVLAIAVYEQDEKFWAGYWGKRICETADEKKTRIFIVSNETQLYELESTLQEHATKYKVYATSSDQARGSLFTAPGWLQDFSIIGNEVVAYYNYGEIVDPLVDKKIVFDISPDILGKKRQEFQSVLSIAQQFTSDYTGKNFEQFTRKVFKKKREISRYIDIRGYDNYEPFHPYYKEMHDEMLSAMKQKFNEQKSNFKILEIGPGTGIFTWKYAGRRNINIDLVELDSDCVEYLLAVKREYPNVKDVINDDILEWNSETKYKIIVSSFSNHHIPYEKTQKFYEKIVNLLDSDGVFIFGEEFIPEHDMSEDDRKKALYKYHTHIMSEALKQDYYQVAELENISLIQGVKKDGEYKVSLKMAKEEAETAGLVFTTSKKIGPTNIDDVGGVFVVIAQRKKPSHSS